MSFQVKNNSKMQFARYSKNIKFPVENKYICLLVIEMQKQPEFLSSIKP